jgi:hypothetical protein
MLISTFSVKTIPIRSSCNQTCTTPITDAKSFPGIRIKLVHFLQRFTLGTDRIGKRIPTRSSHSHSRVQRLVIGTILTDHQIAVAVVAHVLIHVMDFCALW